MFISTALLSRLSGKEEASKTEELHILRKCRKGTSQFSVSLQNYALLYNRHASFSY
jgi:hypothetical protein